MKTNNKTQTQTENTKESDKSFEIDCNDYPQSKFRIKKVGRSYRAICNKCGSEDCRIIEVIKELK